MLISISILYATKRMFKLRREVGFYIRKKEENYTSYHTRKEKRLERRRLVLVFR